MIKPGAIAVIANREGQASPTLLSRMAAEWRDAGASVVGVLAQDNDDADATCSAGYLCDIASGRTYSIHLDTPPADTACHLDGDGMADASAGLLDQIVTADVVILSKFGKLEAAGRGLRPAFKAAIVAGKPLLTTVSPRHVEAMKAFAPQAIWLEADGPSVERWWQAARPAGFAAPVE